MLEMFNENKSENVKIIVIIIAYYILNLIEYEIFKNNDCRHIIVNPFHLLPLFEYSHLLLFYKFSKMYRLFLAKSKNPLWSETYTPISNHTNQVLLL